MFERPGWCINNPNVGPSKYLAERCQNEARNYQSWELASLDPLTSNIISIALMIIIATRTHIYEFFTNLNEEELNNKKIIMIAIAISIVNYITATIMVEIGLRSSLAVSPWIALFCRPLLVVVL